MADSLKEFSLMVVFALMAFGAIAQHLGGSSDRRNNSNNNNNNSSGNDNNNNKTFNNSVKLDLKTADESDMYTPAGLEISHEKRLLLMLEKRYSILGKDGRPVKNTSHPVLVKFGLGLIKMELHEKENMLSMSTWTRYRWKDEYLQWDPADFNGIEVVKMSYDKIWVPDVMLYNTANTDEGVRKVMAVITWEGTVTWYPHKMFQSSCEVDVRNFPFDNQTCYMWFGSWTHTIDELDLQLIFPGGVDLSTFVSVYKDASEWEVMNCSAERLEAEKYAILSFTLKLKRKMMFSTYILTMPAIFLSFLTLLVFWLPPEHADKSALGMTIFGSMLLLLLILVEAAPPTASAVPLLGVFYCFTTVIVILSIFLSSLVVKIGQPGKTRRPLPRWLRKIAFGCVARFLCIGCASVKRARKSSCRTLVHNSSEMSATCELFEKEKEALDFSDTTFSYSNSPNVVLGSEDNQRTNTNGLQSSAALISLLERRLRTMQNHLRDITSRQREKDQRQKAIEDTAMEWRSLAMVLDRLFFIAYLIVIITSLIVLFPRGTMAADTGSITRGT